MKNKKGFTLIELLAIIVIIAIIAVITTPIILNIIEQAKQGAAKNSAYGYKDAIQKFYTSELLSNSGTKLDGTYTVQNGNISGIFDGTNTETKEIPLSGNAPTSGSLVFENNTLKSGCIVIDEYAITFSDGKPQTPQKGICENGTELALARGTKNSKNSEEKDNEEENKESTSIILTKDNDNDEKVTTGDYVKIGDDGFYILNPPVNGQVLLIAEYNLDSTSRQNASEYLNVAFSNSVNTSGCSYECSYWWNYSSQSLKSDYETQANAIFAETYGYNSNNEKRIAYIYRDKFGNDTQNNVKTYINNYKEYLSQIAPIEDVRIISYEEAIMAGCTRDNNGTASKCPDWMSNQKYWTGSEVSGWDYQLYMQNNNWDGPNESSSASVHQSLVIGQTTSYQYGIRPVVVVSSTSIGK